MMSAMITPDTITRIVRDIQSCFCDFSMNPFSRSSRSSPAEHLLMIERKH
jgi:hypothetical protein